ATVDQLVVLVLAEHVWLPVEPAVDRDDVGNGSLEQRVPEGRPVGARRWERLRLRCHASGDVGQEAIENFGERMASKAHDPSSRVNGPIRTVVVSPTGSRASWMSMRSRAPCAGTTTTCATF